MNSPLLARWLGPMSFRDALVLQEDIVRHKREEPAAPDQLLLLEHEPVYTIGRTPDQSSLRGAKHLPHPLFEINRGGQATYHGPGQLMGYFLFDLRRYVQDLHRYLRWIEALLIKLLARFQIEAGARDGLTGVWIEDRKIASIGVGVRHWITMHGFALNVGGDLAPFDHITPCGIDNLTVTSMERETGLVRQMDLVAAEVAQLARARVALLGSTPASRAGAGAGT